MFTHLLCLCFLFSSTSAMQKMNYNIRQSKISAKDFLVSFASEDATAYQKLNKNQLHQKLSKIHQHYFDLFTTKGNQEASANLPGNLRRGTKGHVAALNKSGDKRKERQPKAKTNQVSFLCPVKGCGHWFHCEPATYALVCQEFKHHCRTENTSPDPSIVNKVVETPNLRELVTCTKFQNQIDSLKCHIVYQIESERNPELTEAHKTWGFGLNRNFIEKYGLNACHEAMQSSALTDLILISK